MTGRVLVPMQSKKYPPGTVMAFGIILGSYYTISPKGWIHQVFLVKRKDGKIRRLQRVNV